MVVLGGSVRRLCMMVMFNGSARCQCWIVVLDDSANGSARWHSRCYCLSLMSVLDGSVE